MMGPQEYGIIAGIVILGNGAFTVMGKLIDKRNGNGNGGASATTNVLLRDLLGLMRKLSDRMLVSHERWDSHMREFKDHISEMRELGICPNRRKDE